MSVKRYTCAVRNGPNGIYAEMAVRDNGAFVLTEDYEALAVKLAALKAAYNQPVPLSDWQKQQARIAALETALREHNEGCQALCGIGDQEAVACGYRPYFENSGRRCPNCPTYDIIDFPVETPGDAWLCVCGLTVKKRYQCLCGGREDSSRADRFTSDRKEDRPTPPYPWCRQPSVCRGTCPMEQSCGE